MGGSGTSNQHAILRTNAPLTTLAGHWATECEMTRRAFRVLLFLGLLGAAALAGYQGWKLERARVRQLASADAFDTITLRLAQSVIDLRASERAYVSSGQGFDFWKPRVDGLLQQIRQDLASLKLSAAPDATMTTDAAIDALNDAARLETR